MSGEMEMDEYVLHHQLEAIFRKLDRIEKQGDDLMSTVNQGLGVLQQAVADLITENQQIAADVTKLLANQTPGLQPGQVIVNQADIDALTATITSATAAEKAEDLLVNPPPPPSPVPTPIAAVPAGSTVASPAVPPSTPAAATTDALGNITHK
jgi:hypothetical protein